MSLISGMSEPLLAMLRRNTESSTPCDTQKGVAASGGMTTHMLLLQCPSWFDGVEVGGVGREVEDANPEGGTKFGDSWVAVRLPRVGGQFDYVATLERPSRAKAISNSTGLM